MNSNKIHELARLAEQLPPFTNQGMFPPSRYYRFLYQLALYMRPNLSVELGVCGGGGSFNLLQGWNGRVVGIDVSNEYPKHIEFLKQHKNYHFWQGDSIEIAKGVFDSYGEIDILFIDTIHTKERTIQEFEAWYPYLSKNAVVLLDDLYREGMIDAWNYITQRYGEGIRLDSLHLGGSPTDGGFGVVLINKD